jgi:hypothetical protein
MLVVSVRSVCNIITKEYTAFLSFYGQCTIAIYTYAIFAALSFLDLSYLRVHLRP